MFKAALFLGLLAVAGMAMASDVVDLTSANFDSVVNDEKIVLVEFFAPWCGHCKALAPKYEQAATTLKGTAKLAKVDCTVEAALCGRFDVRGYPTLKTFRQGAAPVDYPGAREADAIVSYLRKALLPAVSDLTAENIQEFIDADRVVVIAFLDAAHTAEAETFAGVAEELREDFVFGKADAAAAAAYDVSAPAVVLFKKFDEGRNNFDGEFTGLELSNFIRTNSVPIMDEVGPQNYPNYVKSGLPLAFFFVDSDEVRKSIGPDVEKVAKELKGKINFVYIDANKYGGFADNLNLKQEWPAFAIQVPNKGTKFPLAQTEKLTAERVAAFARDFADGKVKPSLKSEEIPANPLDGNVHVVVGKNYNEVVNSGKDVLIEFYAPWCGHCKKLAPIYDELAVRFKGNDNIVIAKMDATANDLPEDTNFVIEGFPTIKLVRADGQIVDYNGSRTLEDFVEFITKNAVNGASAAAAAADHGHDHHDHDGHDHHHGHDHGEL